VGSISLCEDVSKTEVLLALGFVGICVVGLIVSENHKKDLYIENLKFENLNLRVLVQESKVDQIKVQSKNSDLKFNLKTKDDLLQSNSREYIDKSMIFDYKKINKMSKLTNSHDQLHLKGPGILDRTTRYAMQEPRSAISESRQIFLKEFFVKRDHKILYRYYIQNMHEYRPTFSNISKYLLTFTGYLGLGDSETFKSFLIFISSFKSIDDISKEDIELIRKEINAKRSKISDESKN
jgi:hypothetical protein